MEEEAEEEEEAAARRISRRMGWNARQEDTGVLAGGPPPHTRKMAVEGGLEKICEVLLIEPVEIFSLGKRTQYTAWSR